MTDAPAPDEFDVHDTSLQGVEQEPLFDMPMKAQTDETVVEGVNK